MIRILGTVFFLGVFSSVALSQQIVDRAPSAKNSDGYWPLVCKSGSSVRINFGVRAEGGRPNARITFGRGTTASGPKGENLGSGSCSWVDRGMDDSEPNVIFESDLQGAFVNYVIGDDGNVVSQSVAIPYVVLRRSNQVFYLFVKREGNVFVPRSDLSTGLVLTQVRNW